MQELSIIGSWVLLSAAIVFLLICTSKSGKLNAIYTYIFFTISMLLLALFMFLWHTEFGRVGQEPQSITGSAPVNAGLGQWGQILGGGIVAAILTLSGREVVSWYRRPKLRIDFENKKPFCELGNKPPQSYWLRVKVTNFGKSAARSCVGRLVQFKDKDKNIIDREPLRLNWVGTPWRELELLDPIDLNQGDSVFLNVLITMADSPSRVFLYTNAFLRAVTTARAGIQVVPPQLLWELDELPSTVKRIRIAIYGDTVKPCAKEYSIIWDDSSDYTLIRLEEK